MEGRHEDVTADFAEGTETLVVKMFFQKKRRNMWRSEWREQSTRCEDDCGGEENEEVEDEKGRKLSGRRNRR